LDIYPNDSQCSLKPEVDYVSNQKWLQQRAESDQSINLGADDHQATLRKWKSEAFSKTPLNPMSEPNHKFDTTFFAVSTQNPLKKWRELRSSSTKGSFQRSNLELIDEKSELIPLTPNSNFEKHERENECSNNNSIKGILVQSKLDHLCNKQGERALSDGNFHNILVDNTIFFDSNATIGMNSIEGMFENLEKNEFDLDLNAQYNIKRFQRKYNVIYN
jgi:hypothetical protein